MYYFSYLESVCCSMFSSNCCFLTCIQISQKAGQVVWYSHLFENSPQFVVIHRVKIFGIVNKAEVDVFWNSFAFSMNQLLLSCFSRIRLCATPETAAHQAPPSLGLSKQEHWSGLPFPSPIKVKSESEVAQSCPTPSDPMDCSLPGSSIHGIFQARALEWGAIAFSVI